jgi:tetratricopeptide (TPR) repeat protein
MHRTMGIAKLTFVLVLLTVMLSRMAAAQTSSTHKGHKVRVPDERAGTIIARAESALEKKDYAAAEPLLKEAVGDDPDDYRAWYDLGFLYNATGRTSEAIGAYRKSVAANPQVFETTLSLGLLLARTHDPEAESVLRKATQLKPDTKPNEDLARAWISLGHLTQQKDPQGALAAYREAAKLQPKDTEPLLSAGLLLEHEGKLGEAEKEYTRTAELDPKSADAAVGLANIYQKTGRMPEADAALHRCIQLQPGNAPAHFQLGRVLVAEHKRYDAIEAYEAGLKLQPEDSAAQRELAVLYDIAGKFDKAEALFRKLIAFNGNDAEARAGLGAVLLHAHKNIEAQDELLQAIRLNPRLGDAYSDLALAASDNKNYELAIRALDQRAKLLEDNAGTYFLRATAYDNLRDHQHAAENYRQFLRVANGRFPDQEWQARHRLKAIDPKK